MATRTQGSWKITFHWKDGKVETVIGWGTDRFEAAADAANELGYGGGALGALDYFEAEMEKCNVPNQN